MRICLCIEQVRSILNINTSNDTIQSTEQSDIKSIVDDNTSLIEGLREQKSDLFKDWLLSTTWDTFKTDVFDPFYTTVNEKLDEIYEILSHVITNIDTVRIRPLIYHHAPMSFNASWS